MRLVELASGVDALYLSGRGSLAGEFLERLERAKSRALDLGEVLPFDLRGVEFGLVPHGWGRYSYRLSHEFGLLGFSPSEHLPPVRVQPRAELLAGLGPEGVVDTFADLLRSVGEILFTVSRVDLFADFLGWRLRSKDRTRFVSRAQTRTTFEENGALTGLHRSSCGGRTPTSPSSRPRGNHRLGIA